MRLNGHNHYGGDLDATNAIEVLAQRVYGVQVLVKVSRFTRTSYLLWIRVLEVPKLEVDDATPVLVVAGLSVQPKRIARVFPRARR